MRRILWCAGATAILAGGLLVPACGTSGVFEDYTRPLYIGGQCGDSDDDCHTALNNIPGSICHKGACVCLQGMDQCCPGGAWDESGNPLNCKVDGDYRCRPWEECHPVQTLPEPEPEPEPECVTAADCPPPPDLRCGEATCEEGKCGLTIFFPAGEIAWQVLGDCKTAFCDASGNVVMEEDPNDVPKRGDPCIKDACNGSEPVHTPVAIGEACINTTGVCDTVDTPSGVVRKCVECIWPDDSTCPTVEQVCAAPTLNSCVASSHCLNNIKDGDETSADCGGTECAPCAVGLTCFKPSDCVERVCHDAVCVPPRHDDVVQNDGETGVDCGCGEKCFPCPDGEGCTKPEHCVSGVCYLGLCQVPTCFDMVQNGTEQGVDCGEGCELACPLQSSSG